MGKRLKGTAANNLGYTGIVSLSQYIQGKKIAVAKIHNAGGKPLFNFIADCLADDFDIARLDKPTKILLLNKKLVEKDGNNTYEFTVAGETGFIHLLSKPEKVYSEDVKGIVRYSFMIPQEYFTGTDFNAIGLYTATTAINDPGNYAAYCDVDPSEWDISISSVIVLDWELHISNTNEGSTITNVY